MSHFQLCFDFEMHYGTLCCPFKNRKLPWDEGSVIDSISQNEESKIDYDYVMMMRNIKFEHTVEIETSNNAPLNYFFFSFWVMESEN